VFVLDGIPPVGRELWLRGILVRLGVRSVQLSRNATPPASTCRATRIAARGRLVGVTCNGDFIAKEGATLVRPRDHVEHVVESAGPDHVGRGSDLASYVADVAHVVPVDKPLYQTDQQLVAAEGFELLAGFPESWTGLRDRRDSEAVITGMAGGNFQRLFAEERGVAGAGRVPEVGR
jgi:microsomal dipeptidase-like Zn-dependent dipeptidase